MEHPGHIADADGLGGRDDARIGLEVFVVGKVGARRQDVVLGQALELGLVGQFPFDELERDLLMLAALRESRPRRRRRRPRPRPALMPGRNGDAEIQVRHVLLQVGNQEAAGALDADLAGLEVGDEVGAVVGLRALAASGLRPTFHGTARAPP